EFRHEHFTHTRDDKVVGALTSPVYFATRNASDMSIGANFRPPTCGGVITTNCLPSGQVSAWQNAYAPILGMISRASQLLTRGADFSPNPAGQPLHQDTIVDWYNLYFADSWRLTPSLTVTLGMGWGAQTPPYELTGLQTIMVDGVTKKPIIYNDFLNGLANGVVPTLAYAPIKSLGRKYPYDPEWNDFEPRLSFAWNPSSFLKPIFGEKKTVIRGGYGRFHDRLNGVGLVMTPALGIGFGNTVNCRKVKIGGVCGGAANDPTNAFRIGVDGSSIPLPTLGSITGNLIPGTNSPFEILDFRIDPHRKVGVEDTWDLSIQRQLPSNMLLEVGYVGRVAHHLYTVDDLNQVPYMMKAGGQTFANAFDAIAKQVRAGQPVTAQPFFENILGGGQTAVFVAAEEAKGAFFTDGLVTNIFDDLVGMPLLDNQVDTFQVTTSNGNSNYHAGYVSVRKQFNRGLLFQANYTWSHSFDTIGFTQENVFISPSDNFNPHRDYGPSQFDRRHTFNLFYVYDLPFGKGHYLGGSNNLLDKIIGGWSFSGQFVAASGIPLDVINNASCEEFGAGDQSGVCSAMLPLAGAPTGSSLHYNPDGSVSIFGNPNAANLFGKLLFADQRTGHGAVRSFPRWNYDAGLSKQIVLTERVKMAFGIQAVNLFNHMEFNDASATAAILDISSANFGKVSTQYTSPRFLNLNIRFDF